MSYLEEKEQYACYGVDADAAIARLMAAPVALHCWQGDDVRGFDTDPAKPLTGGIQTTGNYPGRARTPEELMADLDQVLKMCPGTNILADEDGKVVFAYDPSQDELAGENARTYQGAIISAPTLQMGQSYRLYIGGQVEGQESGGVYDVTTVTGFAGATRQSYGGNGTTGGMDRPEDQFPGGELTDGQIPEGQFPGGEMPGGEIPEGQFPGGEMPDGEMPGGQIPGDMAQTGAGCAGEAAFTLTERVSVFTAVSDYTHTMTENDDGSFTCTHCGLSVSPAEAQDQEPQETPQDGTSTDWVLAGAAIFAGVAMLALAVVLIVLYRKKKQG